MVLRLSTFRILKLRKVPCRKLCSTVQKSVRVRFAPSPTGFMHLGGLRTAFYNYMFAKRNDGKFILRIEDTDQKRVIPGSAENLEKMLSWAGLSPDESPSLGGPYGPYVQSQRVQKYRDYANQLLESGSAYRCFCSETRLDLLRKKAMLARENPGYDNKCRHLTSLEIKECLEKRKPFTIRFKLEEEPLSFEDIVFGTCTHQIYGHEGDFIILKSDGFPTYHFACVVDDHLMDISHVLRGKEWLTSTTKHIMLHKAFKWTPPKFAHLPLLVNSDGSKLSKRQDAIGVEHFKELGYAPEVLINFLASAGGGFGKPNEMIMVDMKELYSKFDLTDVRTHPCVLDVKKLTVFSHRYLVQQLSNESKATMLVKDLQLLLKKTYGKRYDEAATMNDAYVKRIFNCYKERIDFLTELVKPDMEYLWTLPEKKVVISRLQETNLLHHTATASTLEKVKHLLQQISETDFLQERVQIVLKEFSSEQKLKYSSFMKMLRIVLTGQLEGPSIGEILYILGQEKSCRNISSAIEMVESKT